MQEFLPLYSTYRTHFNYVLLAIRKHSDACPHTYLRVGEDVVITYIKGNTDEKELESAVAAASYKVQSVRILLVWP